MICEFLEKKVIARSQHEFALNRADQPPSVPFVTAVRLTPSAPGASAGPGKGGMGWGTRSCPPPGIAHVHMGFGGGLVARPHLYTGTEGPPIDAGNGPHAHTDASEAAAKASSRRTAWLHRRKLTSTERVSGLQDPQ